MGKRCQCSLDDWDMRSGRNYTSNRIEERNSLDDWDMRSGRNFTKAMITLIQV